MSSTDPYIGRRLGPYEIEAWIGKGGAGAVYRAVDTRLGRQVAIKLLHADKNRNLGSTERFLAEARATSKLDHPNICTVYDIGSIDEDTWYLVMAYYRGETLSDRLRHRRLDQDEALDIAKAVASGLQIAHENGIVHRDIKPDNIMLTERGEIKILDFGIARILDSAHLTKDGHVVGTPAYMSPEQATGKAIDHRTDIWSLTVMLYEMLGGDKPFTGDSSAQAMYAIVHTPQRPIEALAPDLPKHIHWLIERGLRKDATARIPSIDHFLEGLAGRLAPDNLTENLRLSGGSLTVDELKPGADAASLTESGQTLIDTNSDEPESGPSQPIRQQISRESSAQFTGQVQASKSGKWTLGLAVVAIVIALTAIIGPRLGSEDHPPAALTQVEAEVGPPRIAVLPFSNIGPAENDYFADGMTDEVRSRLASLSGLTVIASTSCRQYRDSDLPAETIAAELDARFLLLATVRWQKTSDDEAIVRVTPELIEIGNSNAPTTRWQDSFDFPMADVFTVQTAFATRVSQALNLTLGTGERQALGRAPTSNIEAYSAYLKGKEIGLSSLDPTALREAAKHYERAVALDPEFALAWAALSRARTYLHVMAESTPEMRDGAVEAAQTSLRLEPSLAQGRLAMGEYHGLISGRHDLALEEYRVGLATSSNNADLLGSAAYSEQNLGLWNEALEHHRQAQYLDPRAPLVTARLAATQLWMRNYGEAARSFDRGLAIAPNDLAMLQGRAMVDLAQGDLDAARAVLERAPKSIDPTAVMAYVSTYWGLYWLLDDDQLEVVSRLPSNAFANPMIWALIRMYTAIHLGDEVVAVAAAEEADELFQQARAVLPGDAQLAALHGNVLAYLGRRDEAIAAAERAIELEGIDLNAFSGAYIQSLVVRIHLQLGEPDRAVELLTPLLRRPFYISHEWIEIDPELRVLSDDPQLKAVLTN